MKIAIISSVYEQTPPLRYGGIERVLDFLVKGLKTKGHDVTLFATGDSSSPCNLVHFFDHPVVPYEPNAQIIHSQKAFSWFKRFAESSHGAYIAYGCIKQK